MTSFCCLQPVPLHCSHSLLRAIYVLPTPPRVAKRMRAGCRPNGCDGDAVQIPGVASALALAPVAPAPVPRLGWASNNRCPRPALPEVESPPATPRRYMQRERRRVHARASASRVRRAPRRQPAPPWLAQTCAARSAVAGSCAGLWWWVRSYYYCNTCLFEILLLPVCWW